LERVYIGMGSNLKNPLKQIDTAIEALKSIPLSRINTVSSLYCSQPWDLSDQPLYINGVIQMETALPALDLLSALWQIENAQGRIRQERFGPRTLDLDILLYGNFIVQTPVLELPHPRMTERDFVLYPLAEIAPHLCLPGRQNQSVKALRDQCKTPGIYRLMEMTCYA
jgi:2-amino-4-hydroxy-6-hydroxymethyldihydropteridine diphosphokinase